jgi:hypothetical protein
MVYRRGKVYWYRIKITRTEAEGEGREYVVDRSAHTKGRRQAEERMQ